MLKPHVKSNKGKRNIHVEKGYGIKKRACLVSDSCI
jgi:hypothetical protein